MRIFNSKASVSLIIFLLLVISSVPLPAADDANSTLITENTEAQMSALSTDVSDNSTRQTETLLQNDIRSDDKPVGDSGKTSDLEIADPLEPLNRVVFGFNDILYTVVLRPLTGVYNVVVAEDVRDAVDNFFYNLFMPVRFVNAVLQLKFEDAGTELLRFGINSTIGIAGLADFASSDFNLKRKDKDTGQTLAYYGFGQGFYIVWPFLGPMSLRDSFGYAGDIYLKPINYVGSFDKSLALTGYRFTNNLSLHRDDYDSLREAAVDPYLSLRDAYIQYRAAQNKK
ncbi:MlaA family lipoprotein [Candidatus Magnetomonas plexicatena]|uniref:MlaA family lipoprotein n=1 Tax=Candidatus Magnetomonas plexicatena TaxID=2552947 RepID=UPI001104223D|nr:VacJ family lipoprotein [Nitrospirales bacterium LBB_01]